MATKSSVATKTGPTKAKAALPKDAETPEKDGAEPAEKDGPLPLLDLSDAAVKKMIKQAKKRGYVTYEQLNAVMPSEEVTSEKIEDVLAIMNEMGINVVETEEAEAEEEEKDEPEEEESESGELVEVAPKPVAKSEAKEPSRAHRRSGPHVSARNGLGGAALARGRNRHRQAHRGRPRGDDRGAVRKPADVPGRHHLARRIERRQSLPARHHRSRSDLCGPRRQAGGAASGPMACRLRKARLPARRVSCRSRRKRWRRRRRRPPPPRSSPPPPMAGASP